MGWRPCAPSSSARPCPPSRPQEQVLQREHRRETKRQMKKEAAALDQAVDPEEEEMLKAHVSDARRLVAPGASGCGVRAHRGGDCRPQHAATQRLNPPSHPRS